MKSLTKETLLPWSIALVLVGCQGTGFDPEASAMPVVEAFLFQSEEIDDINVSRLVAFNEDSGSTNYLNDLQIILISEGVGYSLESSPGDSGYYHYSGADLLISSGKEYRMEFQYQDQLISAETTVPDPPTGITLSQDQIEISPVATRFEFRNLASVEDLVVTWDNLLGEYYYILVENIEEDTEEIVTDDTFQGFRRNNFRFVSEPVQDDFHIIRGITLEQYGIHRVQVFKVNQEYADLYENIDQDSRSLNEPPSNIENGLGIFTAFNSDSIFFEVKKP